MNITKIARYAVKAVSVLAVQQVVDNIIVATTPEVLSATNKIMTRIGGAVISAYIGDAVGTFITREWDEIFANIQATKAPIETDGEPVIINPS